ncbi:hypothetical protein D3C85_379780 [compost metagenome]
MQHDRALSILSGQSNLARRVFEAVPKQDYWSVLQISNEMHRMEPHGLSKGEITGCLRSLVDAGLVAEAGVLTFRSTVKPPKPTLSMEAPLVTAPVLKKKPTGPTLMERFFEVATTLRAAAESIETLAMEMDTAIIEAGKGNEKLKEIQLNLRALMGEEA